MKLTKQELKRHEAAMELLRKDRLSDEERETIFSDYHPGATNNITKGAIFFTPPELANYVALMHGGGGRMVDLCAGIGILASRVLWYANSPQLTCIERNPEFVEIGRKLVPEAEWICGDVWEVLPRLGVFDSGISNPPYGGLPGCGSEAFRSSAHLGVAELMVKHCRQGGSLILPSTDYNQDDTGGRGQSSAAYRRFESLYPEAYIGALAIDCREFRDQWRGASPNVAACNLDFRNSDNPYLVNCGELLTA